MPELRIKFTAACNVLSRAFIVHLAYFLYRKSLKLVLMSATLNAESFSNYFGGCPTVSIPGRAQPVQEFRLEDALEVTGHLVLQGSDCAKKASPRGKSDEEHLSKTAIKRLYPGYSKNVIDSLAVVDESVTNYELIADLLQYICTTQEEGAILVFLSGMKGKDQGRIFHTIFSIVCRCFLSFILKSSDMTLIIPHDRDYNCNRSHHQA